MDLPSDQDLNGDTFWKKICNGEDPFDFHATLNSSTPFFNDCFINTALTWPGPAVLLVATLFDVSTLISAPWRGQCRWTWRMLATVLGLVILTEVYRRKGKDSPGAVWLGWFTLAVTATLPFIQAAINVNSSKFSSDVVTYQRVLFLCYYPLVLGELIVHCFSEKCEEDNGSEGIICPEEGSSFISRITFSWFMRTAILGYKRPLNMDDLWLHQRDKAESVTNRWNEHSKETGRHYRKMLPLGKIKEVMKKATFENLSAESQLPPVSNYSLSTTEKYQNNTSFEMAIIHSIKWQLMSAALLRLIGDLLLFATPQLLKVLLIFIDNPDAPLWIGLLLAFLMFLSNSIQTTLQQQGIYKSQNIAMNVRTALASSVYKKALHLSHVSRKDVTVGEMMNYMAVDAQKVGDVFQHIQQLWTTPIMFFVSSYLLYIELGYSALIGFCVMVLIIPIQLHYCSFYEKRNQTEIMQFKDKRMKLMNEIVAGMKMLKLHAWEKAFEERVLGIRDNEVKSLKRGAYLNAMSTFAITCSPFLVAAGSFTAYVLLSPDHNLTPQKAFVSLAIFNILRQPLHTLPMFISIMAQGMVSKKRLKEFLSWPGITSRMPVGEHQEEAILIKNGTFSWAGDEKAKLQAINLTIKRGQLVAIVGPVGCGKSSLLSALLGDMLTKSGFVGVKGSIAYVPQQAWIQSMTVRSNIIFTKPYSEEDYNRVVDGCALAVDLGSLPNSDDTEIGEKGINLSGGQKQRLSLARAIYQDSDVYLMDDPLSTVDAHVGKHIFHEVIGNEGLLKGKTRVLITHSLANLKYMDNIIVMNDGKITQQGTLAELVQRGGPFAEYLETYLTQRRHNGDTSSDDEMIYEIMAQLPEKKIRIGGHSRIRDHVSNQLSVPSLLERGGMPKKLRNRNSTSPPQTQNRREETKQEKVQEGKIKREIYSDYFSAIGYACFLAIVSAYIVGAAFAVGANVWLAEWSEDSRKEQNITMDTYSRLGVYVALGIGQSISTFLAALIGVRLMASASAKLHGSLLYTLIRLPMCFYDVTNLGDIISRVGKDIDVIDNNLPRTFRMWILQTLSILSALIIVVISTPLVAAVILPLGLMYYFLQSFCVSTGRQLRRLESASRGPIYSHFGETITGATSIRAYCAQEAFIKKANFRWDENMRAAYATMVSFRWREFWFNTLGNLLVMFAALFAVLSRDSGIAAAVAGLSITYAASITNTLQIAVRLLGDLETDLVSVERIKEYKDLPREAAWMTNFRPPNDWPSRGCINFEKYTLRYRQGQNAVLKEFTWHVNGQEKVGVVGRTGSGKSSMALALFRIVEPAGGRIVIDNIDITEIGLHDLRSRLAIIPQDPILFSGTIRFNLDPFDEYGDSELWTALEQAHLRSFVSQMEDGLDYKLSEGGGNFSIGQRQLLCLARALLRRRRIVILDEATSAVDLETERIILQALRRCFSDCTLIIIAHRLSTVTDLEKILVMSQGRALENGSPAQLLSDTSSAFFGMAKETGFVDQKHDQ